jgi:hypothetical protein
MARGANEANVLKHKSVSQKLPYIYARPLTVTAVSPPSGVR